MLTLVLKVTTLALVMDGSETISCLEGRVSCLGDITCSALLDRMPQVCDEMIYTCETSHRFHCRSVLSSLQTSIFFRSCTCEPLDLDVTNCVELQKQIFLHACVTHDENSPNVPWLYPHNTKEEVMTHPDSSQLEAIEAEINGEISCIGIRKLCLRNLRCNKVLAQFRLYCKENKKKSECVTEQSEKCFRAIEELQSSDLYSCQCPASMKKPITREKCERIQSRIANNTCLVAVPYYIYSTKPYETTYKDLVTMVGAETNIMKNLDIESTCIQAFQGCNDDNTCRQRMAEFMVACTWNKSANRCNRASCLAAVRRFYLLVRPERTHALLFCRCRHGDRKCHAVKEGMYPTCSVIESPPPTCLLLLERCHEDTDCRVRWRAYESYCSYDKNAGGCTAGSAMCRNAQVGIMGTSINTNCTCEKPADDTAREKCIQARNRLQHRNVCKEMAMKDFHARPTTTAPRHWAADGTVHSDNHDCQNHMSQQMPNFLDTPSVIRVYDNVSDCSEVCQCLRNGTLVCKRLPCSPNLSCKDKDMVYSHGSTFMQSDRGQCRCIRGEMVCAKPSKSILRKPGLYLHVGYSLSDQFLVEGHSSLHFRVANVADKLGALLNGDSAEQFCSLTLYSERDGNLVFEIAVSEHSPKATLNEGCISASRTLSYMINSRVPTIVTDAELSILKIAQLERIRYFDSASTESSLKIGAYGSRSSRVEGAISLVLVCCVMQLICLAFNLSSEINHTIVAAPFTHVIAYETNAERTGLADDVNDVAHARRRHRYSPSVIGRERHVIRPTWCGDKGYRLSARLKSV